MHTILDNEVWKVQRACCSGSGIVTTESGEQQLSCSNSELFCSFYLGSSGQEINWDGNNKQTNYTEQTFTFRHPTSRYLVKYFTERMFKDVISMELNSASQSDDYHIIFAVVKV